MSYTDWYPGEPNSYKDRDQDCLALYREYHYDWDDMFCDEAGLYICEKKMD